VVAIGSRQSQSFTVTIDAGSRAGVGPDMTVVNNDGLVGRVLRVTRNTATVLLVIDPDSTVGGRVGSSMEIGFVTGSGSLDQESGLDLRLVDDASVPARDDTVVTWGSATGPYAPGVPIGTITEVYSSLREASQRAVVKPFVDFSALDVVGVMVPSGSQSDRAVIEADGSLR
jgi:rod shape-determining protein MreC